MSMFHKLRIISSHDNSPVFLSRKQDHALKEELLTWLGVQPRQGVVQNEDRGGGVQGSCQRDGVVAVALTFLDLEISILGYG